MPPERLPDIRVYPGYAELCRAAVEVMVPAVRTAVHARGRCVMALAGGSTPAGIYALMGGPEYRSRFPWANIHLFLGDERFVPADHPRSNYAMVRHELLQHVPIPEGNVHPVDTSAPDAVSAAARYAQEIAGVFEISSGEMPVFDIILLGLGEDGHTASLFPGTPAVQDRTHVVVAAQPAGVPESRISLTLPAINNARSIFFVVSGAAKAGILSEILTARGRTDAPAAWVQPCHGDLVWFLDRPAAGGLGSA